MPAKLTIPSRVQVNSPTTYLRFTSTNQGYINGPLSLNTSTGAITINQTKLYFIALSVTFEQEGKYIGNVARIQVYRNNNTILDAYQSYNVNDDITMYTAAYVNLNARDVITASISFADSANRDIEDKNIEPKKASPYTVTPPIDCPITTTNNDTEITNERNFDTNIYVLARPNATFINIV